MPRRLLLSALLATGAASAQAPASSSPPACDSAEHRQFDFWVGEWEVTGGADGKTVLGHNTITPVSRGCALHEHWRGASGYTGQSLNAYDRQRGRWGQVWIGGDGVVLRLEGGLVEGAMVLAGELPRAGGGRQLQRITWTPAADGSVSQHWETSDDEGATWATSFLGVYRRVTPPAV